MKKITAITRSYYSSGVPTDYFNALLECGHSYSTKNQNQKRMKCHTCESVKVESK